MKKKGYFIIVVCLVLVALALFLVNYDRLIVSHPHAAGSAGGDSEAVGQINIREARKNRPEARKYADPRIEMMRKDPYSIKLSALSGYLDTHKRSPQSLVTAFLLSGDKTILDELRQHQNSPEAVLCIAQNTGSPEEKLKLLHRYIELNPHDMTGYLLAAASVDGKKNREEQLELIKKGMASETFTCGFGNIGNDLDEALISTGMTQTESQIYLSTNNNTSGALFSASFEMVALGSESAISDARTTEDKAKAVENFLSVAESFNEVSQYGTESCESKYKNTVVKLLKNLPGDLVLQDQGTVSDYLGRLIAEKQEFAKNWTTASDLLPKSSPEQVDTFFNKRRYEGYKEANRWLIENVKQ